MHVEVNAAVRRRQHRRIVSKDWLKAARLAANVTQDELARRLDVAVGTVSKRETGEYKVYVETWLATKAALGLKSDWEPPPSPTP